MDRFVPDATQTQAVRDIERWYHDPRADQVYRLFGYAGSGKTSLARHIADTLARTPSSASTVYASFSGKAAHVLQRKGCAGASTIHSLIYKPRGRSRAELDRLTGLLSREHDPVRRATLVQEIERAEAELHQPAFTLNEDSRLRYAKLLILDEVSMVPEWMARDLESFGVKILCLGDPMQLPPVKGEGHYTDVEKHRPDTMLTTVHRSALDSPVTRLATTARTSDDQDFGVSGMDGDSGRSAAPVSLTEFDQILVWRNRTRWSVIQKVRKIQGYRGEPQPGERIIVLSNNADISVLNGQQFDVLSATYGDEVHRLEVRTEDGDVRDLAVFADGFTGQEAEEKIKRHGWRGQIAAATFAAALTVHKAQGSQWDSVLVIDESRPLARMSGADMAQRWFYTALTRAAKRVVVRPMPSHPGR